MHEEGQWSVEFYTTARGDSPVQEYLDSLPAQDLARVLRLLDLLQVSGVRLAEPYVKPLEGYRPLRELRPGAHRVIYFAHTGRRFVMLHAFRKKAGKTRKRDLELAKRRWHEFLERVK